MREFEIQKEKWRIEEESRARAEAVKRSRQELLAIVEQWAFAKRIEDFFEDVERRAAQLDEGERLAVNERLSGARGLLGGIDALARFRSWRTAADSKM